MFRLSGTSGKPDDEMFGVIINMWSDQLLLHVLKCVFQCLQCNQKRLQSPDAALALHLHPCGQGNNPIAESPGFCHVAVNLGHFDVSRRHQINLIYMSKCDSIFLSFRFVVKDLTLISPDHNTFSTQVLLSVKL